MISRRTLLMSGALYPVAGCGRIKRFFQPEVSRTAIDIHAHIFNGRDVPIAGFLNQVILRDPHRPVEDNFITTSFLKLLKFILLAGTPTAKAELKKLQNAGLTVTPEERVLREDEANVAAGLARFTNTIGQQTAGLRTTPTGEELVLDRIAAETGTDRAAAALQTPAAQGRQLAAAIYRPATGAPAPGKTRSYRHRSAMMQTIRWAGLLTRARTDILAELTRLYGVDPGADSNLIRVFSPSIVDFGAWFRTAETVSPIDDQIEVMSALARSTPGTLLLNFAPFCPLRAALEREDTPGIDPLRHVKKAVLERGFAGVKLYPPMGFKPLGNADVDLGAVPRAPAGGGLMLDHELTGLYRWCIDNGVPIKAHANNSIAAGVCTGRYAAPQGWRAVLDQPEFRDLSLNLAHFGGYDETSGHADHCADPTGENWESRLSRMVDDYPNLYFDLGYWTEVIDRTAPERARVIAETKGLIAANPAIKRRMMYGSDWSMIGKEPNHPEYLAAVQGALGEIGLGTGDRTRIMGGNAARYLGLDRRTPQRARLAVFFANHPVFQEIFTG